MLFVARISPVVPDDAVPIPNELNLTLSPVPIAGLPLKSPYAPLVATVAKPETEPAPIAIFVAVTEVTLPFESTAILGTTDADPNVPVLVPALLNLASGNVPELILPASVVFVVAEAANPETAPEAIAIATLAVSVNLISDGLLEVFEI
jgi:hypothetical protein